MAGNGSLPRSQLAPIPGGYLRKDAAAAWNAMYLHAKRLGVTISVNGPDSSYRTLPRQRYWKNWWCARGRCGNAAVPGTSNHGLGLAVDVPPLTRRTIDRIGEAYGWAKKWSDASHEAWHIKWRPGVWKGSVPPTVDVFTKIERRLVDELWKIRRTHGKVWNRDERRRAEEIKRWIREQRARIRSEAEKTGWDRANRRARYGLLEKAYKAER